MRLWWFGRAHAPRRINRRQAIRLIVIVLIAVRRGGVLESHGHILLLAARIVARLGIHTLEVDVGALAALLLLIVLLMCHDDGAVMLHLASRVRYRLVSIHGAKSGPALGDPSCLAAVALG